MQNALEIDFVPCCISALGCSPTAEPTGLGVTEWGCSPAPPELPLHTVGLLSV